MESNDPKKLSEEAIQPPATPIQQAPSLSERLLIPTLLAAHPNIPVTYATNFAIVAGYYCGARELVRVTRKSEHGDLMNSAIGGLFSGALLGRLQGGHRGAVRYSLAFATLGTAFDYASLRAKPILERVRNIDSITLPVWFPIQILDEEALAKKKAQEQKLFPRLNKEKS
ncbi:hypothetical protein EUTSA_v10026882mg [Eutrema salsugineum]|uniref:Uncharacterized protein n=1 Tax=Eutrema salsugineum TaxID=72664 RepID=V4M0D5_EUTSA|nr:hypothetical protein EUTSA_v10026882mg [Eutrema salsugineum]